MQLRPLLLLLLPVVAIVALGAYMSMPKGDQSAAVALGAANGSAAGNTCLTLTRALSLGTSDAQSGGEVTKLQQFLSNDKVLYPEAKVTGYFGPATERAVKRWQAAHGISNTGAVGPLTRSALACKTPPTSSGSSSTTPPSNQNTATTTPASTSSSTSPAVPTTAVEPKPTCTLTTDKEVYDYNERLVVSWTTTNATHVTFAESNSSASKLPIFGTYGSSGSLAVSANVSGTPSITLVAYGKGGSGTCSKSVTVRN